jgi:uncharacterized membrane protein
MATALAFLGMWLLSLVVAVLAALQLGDFFGSGDELAAAIIAVTAEASISLGMLAVGYRFARRASLLDAIAFCIAMVAVALALWPGGAEALASQPAAGHNSLIVETLLPVLLAVLIQWGLLRQRWLRTAGEVDISQWPWLSTMSACVLALNPLGLALISTALHAAPRELPADLATALVTGTACALVVAGAIECYIRWHIQRRRLPG